jgi:hypothetical protein
LLQSVHAAVRLSRRKPPERADVDVVVRAGHVRIRVVRQVVLEAPQVGARAEHVERHAQEPVDAGAARIGAMVGIVLDAEPDAGRRERQRNRA